jgi:hypothetical protein
VPAVIVFVALTAVALIPLTGTVTVDGSKPIRGPLLDVGEIVADSVIVSE